MPEMSSETAGMILERLILGQRVAVMAENHLLATMVQRDILAAMPEEWLDQAKVRVAAGRQRIELGEGRVTFHSLDARAGSLRGYSLDAIYLPAYAPLSRGQRADMLPCLMVRDGIMLDYSA